jgi:D-arabinose 5-phosphate isomerase GutQ
MAKKVAKKAAQKPVAKVAKKAVAKAPAKTAPVKKAPDKNVTTTVSFLTTLYGCIHEAKEYLNNDSAISRLIEAETLIESLIQKAK